MSYKMDRELIKTFAGIVLATTDYDVYVAERGTYGFYTNGERVVSFGTDFGMVTISGNYEPTSAAGTGWRIGEVGLSDVTEENLARWIRANAPGWTRNPNPVYTTLDKHLERYGSSSRYTKIEKEAA